ncbi:DUF695 domain-containing protein [Porphyromonas sp.]|uniref:DUF695 domain-containing protein n=1 Tax=Porphyromonas sp. TaxID=1924944 RepID=UPI0026DB915C|nr:DUF695 domain-containing protein [Porphyromonas sp.]MDO4771835.1 DUF695 domain-containing protein [Porphyromonas sp.]
MAKVNDEMITVLLEGEHDPDKMRFLLVRKELLPHLETGKYPYRIEVRWAYEGDGKGMPQEAVGAQMEAFEEALRPPMERNKLALLAYVSTGEGLKEWCFYTRNLKAFGETLNAALADLPQFPLSFEADEDREGEMFREVLEIALDAAHDED